MKTKTAWFMSFLFALALTLSACGNATSATSSQAGSSAASSQADSSAASATSDSSAASAQADTSATSSTTATPSAATNGKKYIYLAGPFFNDEELKNVEFAESILEKKGYQFFSPRRQSYDSEPGTKEWAYDISETDRSQIENADVVVALYYGNDSDSGTAWECGYAAAIGKPIVLVHAKRDGDSNLMMHCGATTNIYLDQLADFDFEAMPVYEYEGTMI